MKDPIQKYFQVGTIQWMSFPNRAPMESLKAIARDDFFDAIELKAMAAPRPTPRPRRSWSRAT